MKLRCSVKVINRVLPNLSIASGQNFKNAVLAVMKPSKEDIIYLMLITSKNKLGTRYKIKENIEKTFGQFRNEGKTTIRFKEPPHDLCITADKIELGNFMTVIKKVWNNEEKNIPEIHKQTLPVIKTKNDYKLEIKTKSQYPVLAGFPTKLQILNITNCQLKRIDNRILKLKSLTTLCLDKNSLTDIPVDLKNINLKYLSLCCNKLGQNFQCWRFLAKPLADSLEYLDLSGNEIKVFPSALSRFIKLKILKLSKSKINKIPFQICSLPNLQELDVSRNYLLGLPGTVTRRFKKFDKLDISEAFCSSLENRAESFQNDFVYVPSLFEISVRAVIDHRIPYCESTIPHRLVPILDLVKLCLCGKTCGKEFGSIVKSLDAKSLANTTISSDLFQFVPIVYQACCPQHLHLKK